MHRLDGGSSSGRTTDSDSVYLGSNPSPPAICKAPAYPGALLIGGPASPSGAPRQPCLGAASSAQRSRKAPRAGPRIGALRRSHGQAGMPRRHGAPIGAGPAPPARGSLEILSAAPSAPRLGHQVKRRAGPHFRSAPPRQKELTSSPPSTSISQPDAARVCWRSSTSAAKRERERLAEAARRRSRGSVAASLTAGGCAEFTPTGPNSRAGLAYGSGPAAPGCRG